MVTAWYCCLCAKHHWLKGNTMKRNAIRKEQRGFATCYKVGGPDSKVYLKKAPTLQGTAQGRARILRSACGVHSSLDRDLHCFVCILTADHPPERSEEQLRDDIVGYACNKMVQRRDWSNMHAPSRDKQAGPARAQAQLEGQLFVAQSDAAKAAQEAQAAKAEAGAHAVQAVELQQALANAMAEVAARQAVAQQLAEHLQQARASCNTLFARVTEASIARCEADRRLAAVCAERDDAQSQLTALEDENEAALQGLDAAKRQLEDAQLALQASTQAVADAQRGEEQARRLLKNQRQMRLNSADTLQQRTIDGGVRSGFTSVGALYKALCLRKDRKGKDIPLTYQADFQRSFGEYGATQGRIFMKSLHTVIDSILDTYERNPELKDGLFKAYATWR